MLPVSGWGHPPQAAERLSGSDQRDDGPSAEDAIEWARERERRTGFPRRGTYRNGSAEPRLQQLCDFCLTGGRIQRNARTASYCAVSTSVRIRAVGAPASAGDASRDFQTVFSRKPLKAVACSTPSNSNCT